LYKQPHSPSQPKSSRICNDIELNKTILRICKSLKVSATAQLYLRILTARLTRSDTGIELDGCRWDRQQTYADDMGCSRGVVVRAEHNLVSSGVLTKNDARSADGLRPRRELRLGTGFFLALGFVRSEMAPKKKANDLPEYYDGTDESTVVVLELIQNLGNTDVKIGDAPKSPHMPDPKPNLKKEPEAGSNPNSKQIVSNILRGLSERTPYEKKSCTEACDIVDRIFPKSGDGFIPWPTLNPLAEGLIKLVGSKKVLEDLESLFKNVPIAKRLERSDEAFRHLENKYKTRLRNDGQKEF
jgi:hypothetical protein